MKKQIVLHLLIITAFGIVAYANSFSNEFLYDDEHYVQKNPYIKDFSHLKDIFTKNVGAGVYRRDNFYRPMQLLAYSVVHRIFGLDVFGFHLLNFLLHLGNAFLIYFLVLILFKRIEMSFISSLLFMVHPVHTEAVTYMNGTADPLAMFFGLLTLSFYLKADKHIAYYFISLICFTAALMSKETIVILPFLIIAVDLYKREFTTKKLVKYIPYFILLCCYILVRLTIFNFTNSLNLFVESNIYTKNLHYRLFTFLASLTEYYKLLLLPIDLKYDRAMIVFTSLFTPKVLFSFILFFIFSYFVYRSFKSNRVVFLGFIWFFISLGPVSGIIPINAFILEHWLYFPSIGFFMVFSYLALKLNKNIYLSSPKTKWLSVRLYIPLILVIAIIFSYLTFKRNKDWKSPIIFYNKILEHNPGIARVYNNLGMAYADKGMLDEAEKQYKIAIALEDRYAETHHNLARLYLEKGIIKEGILELKKAIAIDDNFIYSHLILKEVYERLGMTEEARKESVKIDKIISN
jgi:tetratricopeptide (TPR) repeat protein